MLSATWRFKHNASQGVHFYNNKKMHPSHNGWISWLDLWMVPYTTRQWGSEGFKHEFIQSCLMVWRKDDLLALKIWELKFLIKIVTIDIDFNARNWMDDNFFLANVINLNIKKNILNKNYRQYSIKVTIIY